jgi:hypothetical protein
MPSSSTHYSLDIPTVGSDSTTYGTIINEFANDLATKLKTVADKINTAGVGASSTLTRINNYISQVNNINNRLPNGVANLLPDPYSGSLTPVSTWPYLNSELTAAGFSPPTTAQEVLDFDYTGFANFFASRIDSLQARVLGLDAAITIHDTDRLVCEANTILDAIGDYKSVPTTTTTTVNEITQFFDLQVSIFPTGATTNLFDPDIKRCADLLYAAGFGTWTGSDATNDLTYTLNVTAGDIYGRNAAGEQFDEGIYIQNSNVDLNFNFVVYRQYNYQWGPYFRSDGSAFYYYDPHVMSYPPVTFGTWGTGSFSDGGHPTSNVRLRFLRITNTGTAIVETTEQVKVDINDVDLSGCS